MRFDYTDIPDSAIELSVLKTPGLSKEACAPVDLSDKKLFAKLEKLGWNMVNTCVKSHKLGLSAPQVGINESFFVCVDFQKNPWIWQFDGTFSLFINPVVTVVDKSDTYSFSESCGSFEPGVYKAMVRPKKIMMTYWYFNEKKQLKQSVNEEFEGYPARMILHELDHLSGAALEDKEFKKPRRGRPPKVK